ncbi:MAG: glycosyl transferase family 28 [Ferruginibacter sp.]|nr:glycosyl transferase family 28 [Chitinophagaceae bacterium]
MDQPFRGKTRFPEEPVNGKPRILVAPLDWGLGHATRCIPIIRELLAQGADVWLAGEGMQERLLQTEFPHLPFLVLPGYRIRYAKTKRGLVWKMIQQGPKMRRAIQYEHRWLKKMVKKHQFTGIISDNRYGFYHSGVPSIFITHQLVIKSAWAKWTEKILQKRNYRYINRFTACWVPDSEEENNLAGELSHPHVKPAVPVHYIGLLSRFEKKQVSEKENKLLIILSGPEPQRNILEEKIINSISHYNGTATIVRGLPGTASLIPSTGMIKFYNHLPAPALNDEMLEAAYVISRSGYSSVMDIVALQKKSILIPTPGQTEQEYLGRYLMEKGIAVCADQNDFSLEKELATAAGYAYKTTPVTGGELAQTIKTFLAYSLKPALG